MFGLATEGLALVNQGEVADGMRCLDEATAAALGGQFEQLAPAGWTCCYMIYACERVRDYDRAAQWCGEVEAFSRRMHIRFVNGTCRAHYPSPAELVRWEAASSPVAVVDRPDHGVTVGLVFEIALRDRARLAELDPARADMNPELLTWLYRAA